MEDWNAAWREWDADIQDIVDEAPLKAAGNVRPSVRRNNSKPRRAMSAQSASVGTVERSSGRLWRGSGYGERLC